MAFSKTIITFLVLITALLACGPAYAIPPDFNADRRVNIKCPSTIDRDHEGQFELDGFKNTLRRLYHELDKNLKGAGQKDAAGKDGKGYAFSADPNHGRFFICHAKASFSPGDIDSLSPQIKIDFQEVFFITRIDWDRQQVELIQQRSRKKFTIDIPDFEKAFLWYNALLDKNRAFIPVYGFLSLPGEASEFPTIWNSYKQNKTDTATPPESLIDYDFYKILDYRNGYYLLGKDYNELDYRDNIEDFGIIGWVQKKYITLWRSRLYYHPLQQAKFFKNIKDDQASAETDEINRFYVEHAYLKERLFNDIAEKLDQESLHKFYTHFGFPQLSHPEFSQNNNFSKVFIPGAFTPRLMKLLGKTLKKNLNTFFLIDVSESMRPFADYVISFNKVVRDMRNEGIGLRMNRVFAYWDSLGSDRDMKVAPGFTRVKRADQITFIKNSRDKNYTEPLIRALTKALREIESLQQDRLILPLHEKLLFIITDAGANDRTDNQLSDILGKARSLNLRIYFVYPDSHGIKTANRSLLDTPDQAYKNLENMIRFFETKNPEDGNIIFRKFRFKGKSLKSQTARQSDFMKQHKRLLGGIKTYIDHVFGSNGSGKLPKDVILYFSDEKLLGKMRKWSDRRIQVLNHVTRFIKQVDNRSLWEERIAIPAKPIESYIRAIRTQDDISLSDLKKLIIMNSLISVDDIKTCRKLYNSIKPLIEKKTFKTADAVFYKALTSNEPGQEIRWNRALGEDRKLLGEYLSERGFHLNSFNQAVQRKFMYLKVEELYSPNQ